jgi:hypothetical protein
MNQNKEMQAIESLSLNERQIKFFPIFAQLRPQTLDSGNDRQADSSKHLDTGEWVAHGSDKLCRNWLPTLTAALSGIRGSLGLEW